ncbi:hypothetical protein XH98_35960 [Bradyrhizobium sp. CCBAU 51745]|nr:hypothetical protein [Bradyrhizobium sp. CCBAU 45384]MDA9444395.1 hypothetical protein [Bradyrhizobium sp. CCBAU 51745]
MSVDGLGAGRDIVFVEHAYDTCVRRPRLDRTYLPFTTASVAIRTWAAALRIKLTSARCHSVR